MNDELKEQLGLLADKCENLVAAGVLRLPAQIHIHGLTEGLKDIASELREIIKQETK